MRYQSIYDRITLIIILIIKKGIACVRCTAGKEQKMLNILNGGSLSDFLVSLLFTIPAVLIALTFHEFAHAYVANLNGDPTAKNLGRMTLNPIAHLDIIGSLCMLIFGFGWAKPVPVNPRNYRDYRKGELTVSLAGVTMNLILAILGAFVAVTTYSIATRNGVYTISPAMEKLCLVFYYFSFMNCGLMLFNLIPIYPLDGYHVFELLLGKYVSANFFSFMHRNGQWILIGLIVLFDTIDFSPLSIALNAVFGWIMNFAGWVIGLFV